MFKSIEVVRKGDNIKDTYLDGNRRLKVEKGPGTDVSKIEHRACSSLGTHINSRECYAPGAVVWVTASKPKEEIEEQPPIEITVGEYLESARAFTWVKPEPVSV